MSFEPVMPPYNASDPSATFLSSSCLDFLLIELVPLAYRITNERDPSHNSAEAKVQPGAEPSSVPHRAVSLASVHHSSGSEARKLDEEEELDAVHLRLDLLGYRVGQGLVERQDASPTQNMVHFLWFPCGIVRGALAALGISATVQAEINELPGAVFQIKTLNSKP
ncbi:hypothetical protein E4U53_000305 [Claviceps sorghi]|nr:hypothetical protein E4U53_000305 [Claviceps sorghi]